jgi:hypothetical protein
VGAGLVGLVGSFFRKREELSAKGLGERIDALSKDDASVRGLTAKRLRLLASLERVHQLSADDLNNANDKELKQKGVSSKFVRGGILCSKVPGRQGKNTFLIRVGELKTALNNSPSGPGEAAPGVASNSPDSVSLNSLRNAFVKKMTDAKVTEKKFKKIYLPMLNRAFGALPAEISNGNNSPETTFLEKTDLVVTKFNKNKEIKIDLKVRDYFSSADGFKKDFNDLKRTALAGVSESDEEGKKLAGDLRDMLKGMLKDKDGGKIRAVKELLATSSHEGAIEIKDLRPHLFVADSKGSTLFEALFPSSEDSLSSQVKQIFQALREKYITALDRSVLDQHIAAQNSFIEEERRKALSTSVGAQWQEEFPEYSQAAQGFDKITKLVEIGRVASQESETMMNALLSVNADTSRRSWKNAYAALCLSMHKDLSSRPDLRSLRNDYLGKMNSPDLTKPTVAADLSAVEVVAPGQESASSSQAHHQSGAQADLRDKNGGLQNTPLDSNTGNLNGEAIDVSKELPEVGESQSSVNCEQNGLEEKKTLLLSSLDKMLSELNTLGAEEPIVLNFSSGRIDASTSSVSAKQNMKSLRPMSRDEFVTASIACLPQALLDDEAFIGRVTQRLADLYKLLHRQPSQGQNPAAWEYEFSGGALSLKKKAVNS